MRFLPILLAVVCVLPIWASEPGQPLDCSDWVFLEPGLNCVEVIPYPCPLIEGYPGFSTETLCMASHDHRAIDNQGRRLWVRRITNPDKPTCGTYDLWRTQLIHIDGSSLEVLAYLDDRCVDPGQNQLDLLQPWDLFVDDPPAGPQGSVSAVIKFDALTGRLLLTVRLFGPGIYGDAPALWAFEGFATTCEVLQTYIPSASEISFRVPYMPEGFQQADGFDTYYGDLATVGDWSQVQALQCGYPATAPNVGDYLTVSASQIPAPGQGCYYVTAVNYQGQRRYGRKASGGVLSGRDPALLPACTQ